MPCVALAASYDPELTWRTLETEHFRITFHDGEAVLAEEMAAIAEDIWDEMTVALGRAPRRPVEVVLVDNVDTANGFARTLPVLNTVIYVTAPREDSSLDMYDVWLDMVATHEFTHLMHLDTVEGLPAVVRAALGRIITVNGLSPWWIVEGEATYMETAVSPTGRGRGTSSQMQVRMAVLDDALPPLGAMDGFGRAHPGGNLRYVFGESFMRFVAWQAPTHPDYPDPWTHWNHVYGAGIPYFLPARRQFGAPLWRLYRSWEAALQARYAPQWQAIEARGVTPATRLTDPQDTCMGPSFSPDGEHLLWSCYDAAIGGAVWMAGPDGAEAEVILEGTLARTVAWRPDGKAFAFPTTRVVGDYNAYDDVFLHRLGTDTAAPLTSGRRARDPAFSPDGERLYVVRNDTQDTTLDLLTVDQALREVFSLPGHGQLGRPEVSPDGRHLAVSIRQDGVRDLWILAVQPDGTLERYRRVTSDAASDREPTWTADGRYLVFSSDRSGVANLYAVSLAEERLYQVTNVPGGAFQPTVSPDGTRLAWQGFDSQGFFIALGAFDPTAWWDLGPLPTPLVATGPLVATVSDPANRPAPSATPLEPEAPESEPPKDLSPVDGPILEPWLQAADGLGAGGLALPGPRSPGALPGLITELVSRPPRPPLGFEPKDGDDEDEDEGAADPAFSHPVRPYSPLPTLLPRYLYPSVYRTTFGFMGAVSTGSVDLLSHWAWNGYLTWRTDAAYLGGGGGVVLNRWRPVVGAGASTYVVPYGDVYVASPYVAGPNIPGIESVGERYWDKRVRWYATVAVPLDVAGHSVYAQVLGTWRDSLRALPEGTYTPFLPTRGYLSELGAGWRYGVGEAFPFSISPENARLMAVDAEWTSPLLGTFIIGEDGARAPFQQWQLTGEWREYVGYGRLKDWTRLSWFPNHVLALRAAGGVSFGDRLVEGAFRLGGNFGESPFYSLPEEYRDVRGYPFSADAGNSYYLASAEYRFPLVVFDWGLPALPLFVRDLHGAVFADVGNAFDDVIDAGQPLVGVGAELRLSFILGWAAGLQARGGYAVGLTGDGGYGPADLGAWYLRIGTSF